jgi:septal ring factor EnvC (AmiA/AmiB activator)
MQKTLKNHEKELVTIKGQLNKVQHENQNMSKKLTKGEHVVRNTENLQQEYAKLNELN